MGASIPLDFADPLPPSLEDRVLAELGPLEHVVWQGRPIASRFARLASPLFVMGVLWTGFAVLWIVLATRAAPFGPMGASLAAMIAIVGVPFVVIGLMMLLSPVVAYRRGRQMVYTLTDRRIVMVEPTFFGKLRTICLEPAEIETIDRVERPDGTGDLILNPPAYSRNSFAWYPRTFHALADVGEVETLIRKTLYPNQRARA